MKILFATAEVDPFSKVGGLADVAASLPARLREIGHDIRVVAPCHASSLGAFEASTARRNIEVHTPGSPRGAEVGTVEGAGGVPVTLVRDERYFGRPEIYGDPDDLLRYQFFCRAVTTLLTEGGWTPDVLHLNDWHTAPLAFAMRNLAWDNAALRGIATVFTIHNLRYRGPDEFNDFIAQAIFYSDLVTTVSPTYAREILTPAFGEGLDSLLRLREESLRGILNGLNYDTFDPRSDPALDERFDLTTRELREGSRRKLRSEIGLPEGTGPLAAMVNRLTEQKGVDLVLRSLPEFIAADAQLVILGRGDGWLRDEILRLQAEHPATISLTDRFDEPLARRIYGGCDLFLMPSRYEPCGLGQMIAMRYGAVPLGRRTGGLADTIVDLDEHPETATGFLFEEFSAPSFAGTFERAVRAFRTPGTWARMQQNGMSKDLSWSASAVHYVDAYSDALRARGITPLE